MSRFADLVGLVEGEINNTSKTTTVKQWLNQAQDEIEVFLPWSFLLSDTFLQTIAKYNTGTGTINVTNASTAVSGTGTVWTDAMTGRKFRIISDNEWYTFTRTAATTGTLDRAYEGTTSTTADYALYQDVYKLAADVNKHKLLRNLGQSLTFQKASASEFDIMIPTVTLESSPRVDVLLGRGTETYATGTLSGTAAAKTLTGVGTTWTTINGISKGTKIRIGNYVYTSDTIDSATQITIYEPLVETIAGSTYEAILDNIQIQMWPPPEDSIGVPYRYYRKMPPLVNDWDISQLPDKYHRLLVDGAMKRALRYQSDPNKFALAKSEFNEGLLLMKADFRQTTDKVNVLRGDDSISRGAFFIPDNFGRP